MDLLSSCPVYMVCTGRKAQQTYLQEFPCAFHYCPRGLLSLLFILGLHLDAVQVPFNLKYRYLKN